MPGPSRAPRDSAQAAPAQQPLTAASRTIVKVCGLTRLEDARHAVEAGADWIGMIVNGESPRRITLERAAAIAAGMRGVTTVAVMVAVGPEEALELARRAGAERVQIHRAPPAWPADFPMPCAIVVPVGADGRLAGELPDARHLLMLDTAHPEKAGGTGQSFPWEAALPHARGRPVMIAGGLGPDNVGETVRRVRPFGVDASSSLELSPGIKDRTRVRSFVFAVRAAEARSEEGAA